MKKILFFVLLLAIAGCANIDASLTDQVKVYSDAPVRKSTLQVAVHPRDKQYKPLTAYFHTFFVQQHSDDWVHLGDAFAREFHNVWTEERLFTVQELQPGTRFEGVEKALRRAKARGADLLILGYVPYFYAGSTVDDSAITIRLNIYATGNGDLLWTMIQSARLEYKKPEDWIYFRTETRLPTGPFNVLIRSIARDMAIPLKSWLPDPDADYDFATTTDQMRSNLDPTPEPMSRNPAPSPNNVPLERPSPKGVNLDIEFGYDKATIENESLPLLDALAEALQSPELKNRKILIAGHTDTNGSTAYNLSLSLKRANAVKAYLVSEKGIDSDRIETTGYGKSRPLNTGAAADDMKRNRRVEIRLAD